LPERLVAFEIRHWVSLLLDWLYAQSNRGTTIKYLLVDEFTREHDLHDDAARILTTYLQERGFVRAKYVLGRESHAMLTPEGHFSRKGRAAKAPRSL
jgi:hypothetical protein